MRTKLGRPPKHDAKVIAFPRRHHDCTPSGAGRACIAPRASTVIPLTPRSTASAASFDHHLPGILPRARQLLTTGDGTPTACATADVPPRASISESVVMGVRMFTFCEAVNPHALAIARAVLADHAPGMARPYAAIGKRLAAMRAALGISQAELCRQIKCTTNRWNQYETGERRITVPVAMKVSETYGAGMDWVYRGDLSYLRQDLLSKIQRAA